MVRNLFHSHTPAFLFSSIRDRVSFHAPVLFFLTRHDILNRRAACVEATADTSIHAACSCTHPDPGTMSTSFDKYGGRGFVLTAIVLSC